MSICSIFENIEQFPVWWNCTTDPCEWSYILNISSGITCENISNAQHITEIDLSNMNLVGELSLSNWTSFEFVESLNLSNNQLSGTINFNNFQNWFSLNYVDISHNNITTTNNIDSNNNHIPSIRTIDISMFC